jgi:hypothetical protein
MLLIGLQGGGEQCVCNKKARVHHFILGSLSCLFSQWTYDLTQKQDYAFVKQLYLKALTESSGKAVKDVLLQPRTTRIISLVVPNRGMVILR